MPIRGTHIVAPQVRRTRDQRTRRGRARVPEGIGRDLRAQTTPRLPRHAARRAGKVLLVVLGASALILWVRAIGSTFHVKTIRIEGTTRVAAQEIEPMVRRAAAAGLLAMDLRALRAELLTHPLIKDVEIARVLPDEVRLRIRERAPVALVAQSRRTPVCVDEEGKILGDFRLLGSQTLPLLLGWNEEESELAAAENRQRVSLYLRLQKELGQGEPSYWDRVDQVDVRDVTDVTVNLTESPMTWIHLGDRDFRYRFELSMQVLNAVKRQDVAELRRLGVAPTAELLQEDVTISYIDVSNPSRIVVRLPEPRQVTTPPARVGSRGHGARERGIPARTPSHSQPTRTR